MIEQTGRRSDAAGLAVEPEADPQPVSYGPDYVLLAAVSFVCFFWRLGAVSIFDGNEGLYVQAAREMFLRGDLITPRSNGLFFFDKPPLALWLDVFSFRIFGVSEFAARLPVAVAATLLVFLTYWFGRRYFGRRTGLLAGAMLALNPLFFGTARQMTMDIHQSLWFAVALFCFFRGYTSTTPAGKRWYYGMWAGCGLSFMAKSVPGLFPLPIAFAFIALDTRWNRRAIWKRVTEARVPLGLVLLALIVVPWHYAAYRANGRIFYEEYWLDHHVRLFQGTDFHHAAPVYFYLPALLAGFAPWGVFLPFAVRQAWQRLGVDSSGLPDSDQRRATLLLLTWFVGVLVIFSAMKSKLISYVLPLYPAAALLVARWTEGILDHRRQSRGFKLGIGVLTVAVWGGLIGGILFVRSLEARARSGRAVEFPVQSVTWGVHVLVACALIMAATVWLTWRRRYSSALLGLFASMACVVLICVTEGENSLEEHLNGPLHTLVREAGLHLGAGVPLAVHIGRPKRSSIFFYLPASVYESKVQPGHDAQTVLECTEQSLVDAFIRAGRPSYILTDSRGATNLMAASPGLTIEDTRGRWVLVRASPLASLAAAGRSQPAPHL